MSKNLEVERWALARLKPSVRNARTHPPEQVAQIAASIKEFGFVNPILVDAQGEIVAGHGRLEAARKLKLRNVPVIVLDGLTPEQVAALRLADNQIASNAGWDMELLKLELAEVKGHGFDLEKLGFDGIALFQTGTGGEPGLGQIYTRKIEPPIYKPTMPEPPPVAGLMNETKTRELCDEIERATNLPEDVRAFLFAAAERHTVFHFSKIAEFYAHADRETQRLMERSALVIVDFGAAIENGFVKLSEAMMDQADQSGARNGPQDEG